MFDLEVFDASVLQDLRLHTWSENVAFAQMLSESTATVTNDGHLVLWSKRVSAALRANVFESYNSIRPAGQHELLRPGDFSLKVFYRDRLHWGHLLYWRHLPYSEPKSHYSTERLPEVVGNFTDEQPGFTTLTVVSNKKTLGLLLDRWKPRFFQEGRSAKSALFIAKSGAAIQIRLWCDEVRIEDLIDVFVAGAFAIKEQRRSRMVMGLSYTEAVSLRSVKPSFKSIEVNVEEKYGPFEKV